MNCRILTKNILHLADGQFLLVAEIIYAVIFFFYLALFSKKDVTLIYLK
jgi:hypothetical protein